MSQSTIGSENERGWTKKAGEDPNPPERVVVFGTKKINNKKFVIVVCLIFLWLLFGTKETR